MGFRKRAASVAQIGDGTWGFWLDGADWLVGGWGSAPPYTVNKVWKSENDCVTFAAQTDFAYPVHTPQACVVNDVAYIVGGDTISFSYGGAYVKSSYKFENGTWSQIAADPGIANRCLGCLLFLDDSFYLVGGQSTTARDTGTLYNTVLRSDDGLQSFTEILSDTTTQGFVGTCVQGSCCVHRGKLWRVTGGYHSSFNQQEPDTKIFSSTDGITWEYRGRFKGFGRIYPQVLSHNGKIYVFNGQNGGGWESNSDVLSSTDFDLIDYWTIEELAGGRLIQTYKGQTGWSHRHAPAIWSSPNGIRCFCGSVNVADMWTLEE